MNTNDRLKRAEQQIASLTRGVQAALESKVEFIDQAGGNVLAKAYGGGATGETKRLNALEAQVRKLEQRLEGMYDELGEHLLNHNQRYAQNAEAGEQAALSTLAKAASANLRRATPEGLLKRAEKVLSDPTAMGMVASYVGSGQLAKAQDLLEEHEARADKEGDDEALQRVESQVKEHETLASVSQLGETVSDLQRTLNSLLLRIGKLESRSAAPVPVQTGATVAKAAQVRRQAQQGTDYRDSPEGLMSRLEAVFDSPAQVGALSSALQAGRVDEVREAIERAELAHEGQMKQRARRTL